LHSFKLHIELKVLYNQYYTCYSYLLELQWRSIRKNFYWKTSSVGVLAVFLDSGIRLVQKDLQINDYLMK
jgi:hypothetical protein